MSRGTVLTALNDLLMCTSSRYLDECIESKNIILNAFDEKDREIKSRDKTIELMDKEMISVRKECEHYKRNSCIARSDEQ